MVPGDPPARSGPDPAGADPPGRHLDVHHRGLLPGLDGGGPARRVTRNLPRCLSTAPGCLIVGPRPAIARSLTREAFLGEMNLHEVGPPQGFWGLLTGTEQSVLSGLGRMSVFPPGAALCVEGDPATHVFILVAGWVKILAVTSEGHQMVLALRGHGDIVGEVAGEATGYRTATVQATGTVRALIVGHDKFSSFLDS